MKKQIVLIAIALLSVSFANAQAYKGKGDNKFQVGANFQNNATGLNLTYDFGVGENISFGFTATYALNTEKSLNANFGDKFDMKARFNANIGNVLNIDDNFDIYPGLHLGLKNFGGHLGMRYFLSSGFGIYTELNTPFARYKTETLTPAQKLHNQFTISLGATFNI